LATEVASMSAEIIGLDRLVRRLREVNVGLDAASVEAQREVSADVVREWRDRVPVDSYALHDSITYDERGAYTGIPYARLVQTRAGQEAAARVGQRFERTVASRLRQALGRWAR
jgi:hypothetical protein